MPPEQHGCGNANSSAARFCRRCGSSTDGREPGSEREAPYLHLFEHASEALAIVEYLVYDLQMGQLV